MLRQTRKTVSYTSAQEAEVLKALKETDLSYGDIASAVGLGYQIVYNINYKHNVRPVSPHKPKPFVPQKPFVPPNIHNFPKADFSLVDLEETQKALHGQIKKLMEEAATIDKRLKEHRISFSKDAQGMVSLYGLATEPFTAHYRDWLRFFVEGQGAKLREFVSECAKEHNVVTGQARV